MYDKFLKVKKNVITVDIDNFREIITDSNQDEIINFIIETNQKVLKKYKDFTYIVPVESSTLTDVQYMLFCKNVIVRIQDMFVVEIKSLQFTNAPMIFSYLFGLIKNIIKPELLSRIEVLS
jgi:hypothetical protein